MTVSAHDIAALMEEEFGLDGLSPESPIFSAGLLDSLDVLRLISALEKTYKISVSPVSVTLEMFDNLDGICGVVNKHL
jgi:acyl carrier protein